jgi:hypothetical protein
MLPILQSVGEIRTVAEGKMMTKCIGGNFNGEWIQDGEKRVLISKPAELSLHPSAHFDAKMLPDSTAMTTIIREWYTRRTVRCSGSEVAYYAPEEWSDEQALRFALA